MPRFPDFVSSERFEGVVRDMDRVLDRERERRREGVPDEDLSSLLRALLPVFSPYRTPR